MKTKNNTRRNAPTEAQKEAAKERRRQIGEMMQKIKAMTPEHRVLLASRFGIRTAEGHELSLNNQCLLIMQNDKVSIVGGFQQWRKLGRSVKKGSRALAIWVPCTRKAETGEAAASAIVPHGVDPSDLDESFFVLANVFDITQTETEAERIEREAAEAVEAAARPRLPTSEAFDVEASPVAPAPLALADTAEAIEETGKRWHAASPEERAAYLAATEAEISPPADEPRPLTIWDVEEPAPGQVLLICPPPAASRAAEKPAEDPAASIQAEFDLLSA